MKIKSKFTKILGVGLAVALLASLMVVAAPVSAGTLSLSAESDIPKTDNYVLGVAGVDIVSLAAKGDTLFVATGASVADNITFKSTDAGVKWSSLYGTTSYPKKVTNAVAVAPDDANTVAILTADYNVYYSTNGGSSWSNLGIPAAGAIINAIDISPAVSGVRYLAAGGHTAAGVAELYTLSLTIAASWTARVGYPGFSSVSGNDTLAVKFSPGFASDKTIAVITGNTGLETRFQLFRYETGALTWNDSITFLSADWDEGLIIATLTTAFGGASIALPSSFLGTSEGERIAFVGVGGTGGGGGVFRFTDIVKTELKTWAGGALGPINSVAYHDSGKLVAGDYDAAQVFPFLTPLASSPKAERLNSLKQPGGANKVVVAWVGDKVVAGTSGDESAFSVSTDNAYSFNDISLIDTTLTTLSDVAVSADGTVVYLTSRDATSGGTNDVSIWVKSPWTRVFSKKDVATANADFLVRIAPKDSKAVYIASKGTQDVWVSKDSGKTKWTAVPIYALTTVQDLVVQDADTVYAIDTAGASKTTNAGASWGSKKTLDGINGYMVTLAPNSDILVGGSDGYVAFSKDGGATFTKTKSAGAGNVQVVADSAYATNGIIYAASGVAVKRGKADATTDFGSRSPAIDATQTVKGIGVSGTVVYVLTSNSTDSALWRALNLQTGASADLSLWSSLTTGYEFEATPQALVISTGPKLWAIDTANTLASATDPIATAGPTLKAPATGAEVPFNAGAGKAYDVTFSWTRYASTTITKMQLQIATDSAFDAIIYDNTFIGITSDTIAKVIGPTAVAGQEASFLPGLTYYWRVRVAVDAPMYSPWSATGNFKVASSVTFSIISPKVGETGVSTKPILNWTPYAAAISYEVQVATDSTFAILDLAATTDNPFYGVTDALAYATTYYWRVRGVTVKEKVVGTKIVPPVRGPWVTGAFTTAAKAVEPAAPVTIAPTPPTKTEVVTVQVPVPGPAQPIPSYLLWAIIVIGAVLVIALIVLIVRTRRV